MPGQLVVTLTLNPTIDKSARCPQVMAENKLRCLAPRREPGGGGINVSRVVRELGGETLALWAGGGFGGEVLTHLLDATGLAHERLPASGETRENLNIYEESSGLQYRFAMPGAELAPTDVARCLERVAAIPSDAAALVVSGSLPPGVPDDFFARLRAAVPDGVRLVVDTSGPALRRALEAGVYLTKPNLRELAQLAGRPVDDDAAIDAVLTELVARGAAEVIVTSLGAAGAAVATREGVARFPAPTVPIRSKVGAGDSMVGGLVFALARGDTVAQAARMGVAAGAATVMSAGTELCRRSDVLSLL